MSPQAARVCLRARLSASASDMRARFFVRVHMRVCIVSVYTCMYMYILCVCVFVCLCVRVRYFSLLLL